MASPVSSIRAQFSQDASLDRLDALLADHESPKLPKKVAKIRGEEELHWSDGTDVSEGAWTWFVSQLMLEGPDRASDELRFVRRHLDNIECFLLSRALSAAYADSTATWPLFARAVIGSPYQIHVLGRELENRADEKDETAVRHAVEVLRREGSDPAVQWLAHWADESQHELVRDLCSSAIEGLAVARGLSVVALAESVTPAFGLNDKRELTIDCGNREVTLRIAANAKVTYLTSGKELKTMPRPKDGDDKRAFARGKLQLTEALRNFRGAVRRSLERLQEAMILGRSWPGDRWTGLFVEHPVLSLLGQRFIWGVVREEGGFACFEVDEDGQLLDIDGETFEVGDEDEIRLVHPVDLDKSARQKWANRERRMAKAWKRPFKQLRRPSEAPSGYPDTWDGVVRKLKPMHADQLRERAIRMGYIAKPPRDDGDVNKMTRELGPYFLRVTHDRYDPADVHISDRVDVHDIEVTSDGAQLGPRDIPSAVFSELVTDLKELTRRPR